jgi:hypothetical protein
MKAYRKRQKLLLNARYSKQEKPFLSAPIGKSLLTLVPVHPLQNNAKDLGFKVPSSVWDLPKAEVLALGYFILCDGQICRAPISQTSNLTKLDAMDIKDFNGLKSFLGG